MMSKRRTYLRALNVFILPFMLGLVLAIPAQRVHAGPMRSPATSFPPGPGIEYMWVQSQRGPTPMLAVDEGLCALQSVGGNFRGLGEAVWIRNNHGVWELNGTSQQQGVFARALCVPYSALQLPLSYWEKPWKVRAEHHACPFLTACAWDGGEGVHIGELNSFCYLTGMSGTFDGGGESVSVTYKDVWPSPYLGVGTWVDEGLIQGEANCIKPATMATTDLYTPYSWEQGQSWVRMIRGTDGFCVLNQVSGKFMGSREFVRVDYHPNDGFWYLDGESMQEGVKGKATCLYYQ